MKLRSFESVGLGRGETVQRHDSILSGASRSILEEFPSN